MGRGIRVQVVNNTSGTFTVGVENLDDIIRGASGSNPNALNGEVGPAPNNTLPADGPQYIETYSDVRDGRFSIVIKEKASRKHVASLNFKGSRRGFRNTLRRLESPDTMVDALMSDNKIEITIDRDTTIAPGFPYMKLVFSDNGALQNASDVRLIDAMVRKHGLTDLMFFAHGFNNSQSDARDVFRSYFEKFKQTAPPKKLGVVGVTWPSQAADVSAEANGLAKVMVGAAKFLAFYKMHGLAGKVGERLGGVANRLAQLQPNLNMHLAGHSMGGHLAASALAKIDNPKRVKSVFLIQAATSAVIFSPIGALRGLHKKLGGPLVATHSLGDSQVTFGWTAAQSVNGVLNRNIAAMGAVGLMTTDAHRLTLGPRTAIYDFAPAKAYSLHCPKLKGHDDYKKAAIARAHQAAAGLV